MVHQTTNKLVIFTLFLLMLIFHSCYYDIEQELYPSVGCETSNMSYANDILPILNSKGCISCHGDLATLDLNGYADLKIYVDNGRLFGSINHDAGFRPMPDFQPKIDQCSIDKIKSWIDAGAPNN